MSDALRRALDLNTEMHCIAFLASPSLVHCDHCSQVAVALPDDGSHGGLNSQPVCEHHEEVLRSRKKTRASYVRRMASKGLKVVELEEFEPTTQFSPLPQAHSVRRVQAILKSIRGAR